MTPTTLRYYAVDRHEDASGVSGLGVVAYAITSRFGCIMVWNTGHRTMEWLPSLDVCIELHGHNGATTVQGLDADDPQIATIHELIRELHSDPALAWMRVVVGAGEAL